MFYSPLSSGNIAGVIAQSGARAPHDPLTGSFATSHRWKEAAESQGSAFLTTNLNVSTIEEARDLPTSSFMTDAILSLSDTIFDGTNYENVSNFEEPPAWRPVVDGYVFPYTYGEYLLENAHANVPILTGNSKDEFGATLYPGLTVDTYKGNFTAMFGNLSTEFFALYPASNDSSADDANNAFWQDFSRVSTWQWAKGFHAGGASNSVYTYYWTH